MITDSWKKSWTPYIEVSILVRRMHDGSGDNITDYILVRLFSRRVSRTTWGRCKIFRVDRAANKTKKKLEEKFSMQDSQTDSNRKIGVPTTLNGWGSKFCGTRLMNEINAQCFPKRAEYFIYVSKMNELSISCCDMQIQVQHLALHSPGEGHFS